MNEDSYLFVYGTLLSSFNGYHARKLRETSTLIGPGRVSGAIYDMGHYPGFVHEDGEGEVYGEVYQLNSPEATLQEMDEYEGVSFGLYRRIEVPAQLPDGTHETVWVYEYNHKSPLRTPKIPNGNYMAYRNSQLEAQGL